MPRKHFTPQPLYISNRLLRLCSVNANRHLAITPVFLIENGKRFYFMVQRIEVEILCYSNNYACRIQSAKTKMPAYQRFILSIFLVAQKLFRHSFVDDVCLAVIGCIVARKIPASHQWYFIQGKIIVIYYHLRRYQLPGWSVAMKYK